MSEFSQRLSAGEWKYEPGDLGSSGSWEEPSDPGYPPTIYVQVGDDDIELATINYPQVEYTPDPDDAYDPGISEYGDFHANGKLMAGSKRMLQALRDTRKRLNDLRRNADADTMRAGIGALEAERLNRLPLPFEYVVAERTS